MNLTCPVCNKAGLPDYRAKHTICPQCNSDLKPYQLLHSLSNQPKRNKLGSALLIVFGISTSVLLLLLFKTINEKKELIAAENRPALRTHQNSPDTIKPATSNVPDSANISHAGSHTITYMVRQGDCPSVIAQFFYNDWKMYKKIEKDNNLLPGYILKVGQPLVIKLNKE